MWLIPAGLTPDISAGLVFPWQQFQQVSCIKASAICRYRAAISANVAAEKSSSSLP